ncbi:MAG TPA: DNA polymerase III subunit delta' [Stellaceae bacterium]|nr:DNA polymerase III subunit delta' [Stellaceae bacterium]
MAANLARMSDEDARDLDDEAPEPAAPELPSSRENPILMGHEAAEAALLSSYLSGRLPHAWLITGPRGIGKATLAFRFARFLFAQGGAAGLFAAAPASLAIAPDHPVFRRVASGGHSDLLVVERSYDPRRKRLRTEIVVDDTRTIASFLRLTPAEGGWRIVIVDGADAMNRNAANATLKILEEPPQRTLMMLLSENPGRLPATIRSRCRMLALKPLPEAEVTAALRRYSPTLDPGDIAALARLGGGSVGRALGLAASGGLELYRSLFRQLSRLPEIEIEDLNRLADGLARSGADDAFALAAEMLPGWLARMVELAARGGEEQAALPGEAAAMRALAGRRGLDQWVTVWENLTHLFAEADWINLDRKQVVLNAFFALEAAAR